MFEKSVFEKSLASVFEKSDTEKTTKMQTNNTNSDFQCWKLKLTAFDIEHNIDIICIQEHMVRILNIMILVMMNASHCISMEKLCEGHDRRCTYAISPKIT